MVGSDGVDVDDATADGVVAGRLADGLGVVVEFLELSEEALKRPRGAARESYLARGEFLECGHRLQECGGRGDDDEAVGRAGHTARGAQSREHGKTVTRRGEGLAHVAAVGERLGKHERDPRALIAGGLMEKRHILRDVLGGLEVLGDDEPDRRFMRARELGDDGTAGRRADAGELGAWRDDGHGAEVGGAPRLS